MALMTTNWAPIAPARSGIEPPAWEVVSLASGCSLVFLLYISGYYELASILGPAMLAIILGLANWTMARDQPLSLWTPLFAFRLGGMVFLGIGSLVPYVITADVLDRIVSLYPYTPAEATKVNLIFFIYVTIVIAFVWLAAAFHPARVVDDVEPTTQGIFTAGALGAAFFIAGFSYSLLIDLSTTLEWIDVILPASLTLPFEAAGAVGAYLLTHHALSRRGWWYLVPVLVVTAYLILGLVLYNKSMVLLPTLFVGLAVLVNRVTVLRVIGVTAALVVALSFLQPAVAHARNEHFNLYESLRGGTVGERLQVISGYWTGEGSDWQPEGDPGEGLTRLSQLNIAAYLIAEYDAGMPGETIQGTLIALIPRFVWPDKPIVTNIGSDLYFQISGSDTSFLSTPTAADIYWNLGWAGLLLLPGLFGVMLWIGTLTSIGILRRQDWLMMPFVLLAFRIGLSVDLGVLLGVFVPTVAATIAYFALRFAKYMLLGAPSHSSRPAGA